MSRSKLYTDLLKYSCIGLEMGAAVIIGLLIGIYLDRHFRTEPLFTLIFLVFGFIAAARVLLRALKSGLFEEEGG